MKRREIVKTVRGQNAVDGAGVHLVRVLGNRDIEDFDPFLMLDSFDSKDPKDYTAGFPMHPHRGIETITYLISGEIEHEDSLGNVDVIRPGESQWMTAGSGIMHQEMPQPADRMLGFQLWLNMPQKEKMDPPAYLAIRPDMIPVVKNETSEVRIISGSYGGSAGVTPYHIAASIFDVTLVKGKTIQIPTIPDENVFIFTIEGDANVGEEPIPEKTAVLFGEGDSIEVSAPAGSDSRFIFCSGKPLKEPIAWGGPIVMNTREELNHAFDELRKGTFIKHSV